MLSDVTQKLVELRTATMQHQYTFFGKESPYFVVPFGPRSLATPCIALNLIRTSEVFISRQSTPLALP